MTALELETLTSLSIDERAREHQRIEASHYKLGDTPYWYELANAYTKGAHDQDAILQAKITVLESRNRTLKRELDAIEKDKGVDINYDLHEGRGEGNEIL